MLDISASSSFERSGKCSNLSKITALLSEYLFAIAFVVFTFMQIITGEQFYSVFQIIIAFYFGTQYQKTAGKIEEKDEE